MDYTSSLSGTVVHNVKCSFCGYTPDLMVVGWLFVDNTFHVCSDCQPQYYHNCEMDLKEW